MQKISESTNSANPAGEFTEGNPAAGAAATLLKAQWLNAIQRELVNLVVGSGQDLNPADDGQVLKAVKMLQELASAWDKITGKPTTRDGYKLSDVFTKTETGTAIQTAVAALVASSPAALDTLKELAAALGNDPNFATTMTNALAGKASKATTLGGYGITDAFTKPETTTAIQQAVAALVASSPAALDTLKELADALGNDPNFAVTITNALAGKASKAELSSAVSTLVPKTGGNLSGSLTFANGTEDSPEVGFNTPTTTVYIDVTSKNFRAFAVCDGVSYTPFLYHLPSGTAYAFGSAIWTAANLNPALFATASSVFGVGQAWQDVRASRAANTNYTNTTGRPIQVNVTTADANARSLTVGGVVAAYTNSTYGGNYFLTATVPPGSTYSFSGTFTNWAELR